MQKRHGAIVAGLAITLAIATPFAATAAYAEPVQGAEGTADEGTTTGSSNTGEELPAPADYDKSDFYQDSLTASALSSARTARASLATVSDEMKYFTLYESGKNYDQGFSYYDGYNALGYYQFDRRYSLVGFMRYCVNYDAATFSMFQAPLARAAELSDSSTSVYDSATKRLTEVGQLAEDAWHAAYAANPALFAALQDSYAYTNYYEPTERWLASKGIDISGRADCVKGLVWSMTNLFGAGGVKRYLTAAELSNAMSDREFVDAIVDSLPSSLAAYNKNTQYHKSWINRYEKERATCLEYIAADEAAAGETDDSTGGSAGSDSDSNAGSAGDSPTGSDGSNDGSSAGGSGEPNDDANMSTDSGSSGGSEDEGSGGSDGSDGGEEDNFGESGSEEPGSGNTESDDNADAAGSADNAGDDVPSADSSVSTGGVVVTPPANNAVVTPAPSAPSSESSDAPQDDVSSESADGGAQENSDGNKDGSSEESSQDNQSKDKQAGSGSSTGKDGGRGSGTTDTNKASAKSAAANKQAATKSSADNDSGSGIPEMSDPVVIAGLAAASLTTLGGTALAAGKRGLRLRRNDAAEDGTRD